MPDTATPRNRVLAHTGARFPIVQAPMGWIARFPLASAVSRAGGLGIIETSSGETANCQAEITKMAASGLPPALVKQILGHADITTTNIYATADNQMVRDAIQKAAGATPELAPLWKGDDDLILRLAGLT